MIIGYFEQCEKCWDDVDPDQAINTYENLGRIL